MSAHRDAVTSLVNGGYHPRQAREIISLVRAEAREEGRRAGYSEALHQATAGHPLHEAQAGGFQPGRGYILGDVLFCCDAILPHPMDDTEHAVGWSRRRDERDWKPDGFALSSYERDGWEDITVDPRDPHADWNARKGDPQ
ncbi:hypothetical protein [Streptomyces chartreusis]|uniref:hypothetical protein n=1 Tax=Streptomyces chartreusis TaxID=1969 RepID=UPI003826519F